MRVDRSLQSVTGRRGGSHGGTRLRMELRRPLTALWFFVPSSLPCFLPTPDRPRRTLPTTTAPRSPTSPSCLATGAAYQGGACIERKERKVEQCSQARDAQRSSAPWSRLLQPPCACPPPPSLRSIPAQLRHTTAVDVALAALLGEDLYSFGQLLSHPIVASLDTPATQVIAFDVL